jgi:hypothetical protein
MTSKIIILQKRRKIKFDEYNKTSTNSWKKRLKRIELQIIDCQISRERMIQQFK